MVRFGNKEKRLCNDRLIVKNFKKLEPKDFEPIYHFSSQKELMQELVLYDTSGTVYINSQCETSDFFTKVFEFIIKESATALKKYRREFKSKYPSVKSFDDWGRIAKEEGSGSLASLQSLIMLMVPLELKRRKLEVGYFGRTRTFE